jgi:hypothetical protein
MEHSITVAYCVLSRLPAFKFLVQLIAASAPTKHSMAADLKTHTTAVHFLQCIQLLSSQAQCITTLPVAARFLQLMHCSATHISCRYLAWRSTPGTAVNGMLLLMSHDHHNSQTSCAHACVCGNSSRRFAGTLKHALPIPYATATCLLCYKCSNCNEWIDS